MRQYAGVSDAAEVGSDHPQTKRALGRLALHAAESLIGGTVLFIASAWISDRWSDGAMSVVLTVGFAAAVFLVLFGLAALLNNVRMRRTLGRYGWVVRPARFGEADVGPINGQPTILLGSRDDPEVMDTRSVLTVVWRWPVLERCSEVWYAGPPEKGGGVVSPIGGSDPMWVRPIRLRFLRRFFRGKVERGKTIDRA